MFWSKFLQLQAFHSTVMERVPHRAQLLLTTATKQLSACVVSSSQTMFVSPGKCTRFQSQPPESFHRVPVLLWGTIKKTIPPRLWSSTARAPSGACRTHQLQNNALWVTPQRWFNKSFQHEWQMNFTSFPYSIHRSESSSQYQTYFISGADRWVRRPHKRRRADGHLAACSALRWKRNPDQSSCF